ncbi:helix-turn-helix transcriptional regulator [Vagococcus sp. DIV0080]|uniref:Helix-turn-helix transcriptional regulator n=1 Tax=Candidatus Vagococcus giribetii TaxID=2230876 RepID=A0ABS3HR07_9ENTE|nr:helix-turn-helix transcriptional regulator [Vagococcus sp. DIV0080]MBO0476183.1 helix-turn-helix transcriptional regulator [Vagococcus sp. DIV0080]
MKIVAKTNKLKIALLIKGYSQKDFSELIPMNQASFSNFLNKRSGISSPKSKKITEILGVEFEEIFDIEEKGE